jgi:two-component system response regulator
MSGQTIGGGIDILLVEDNLDHVELIIKALRNNNVLNEVHVATNGEEALDFLYQRGEYADVARPGLILLDIKLPKVDGIEVLRRIKADPKLKSIPAVMLTTSAGNEEMMESYNYGANSYIVKPVDFEQFVKVIKGLKLYWMVINSLPESVISEQ